MKGCGGCHHEADQDKEHETSSQKQMRENMKQNLAKNLNLNEDNLMPILVP